MCLICVTKTRMPDTICPILLLPKTTFARQYIIVIHIIYYYKYISHISTVCNTNIHNFIIINFLHIFVYNTT